MCDWIMNYYVYTACHDPAIHFFRALVDGSPKRSCRSIPHERYIMQQGSCPLCFSGR
jgi:hypothetical protein